MPEQITSFPHLAGTLSFYDIINTVLQKMLGVSDIRAVLQEAGSQGFSVFDSRSRLRAILNKTGARVEHRAWVAEGLCYMAKRLGKGVSKGDIKGDRRTGNKGLCGLLIFKHSLKRHLFQREAQLRAYDILLNTDVSFAQMARACRRAAREVIQGMDTRGGIGQMACRPDSR